MSDHYFITGGAGFIGANYVSRLVERGEHVTIYDNLSRAGAPHNLRWLQEKYGKDAFNLIIGDIRDGILLANSLQQADVVVHLASQVAVTTSVTHPREDFEINALGTFNVVEAVRHSKKNPILLYASTNKVYGEMEEVQVVEKSTHYEYANLPYGAAETQPLDFHSPYGCSKGTGDAYVRDYSRIYGLRNVVLRQSCIFGPRQFGIEDQGWVAWFIIAAITNRPIMIYGNGKQVRDLLYIDDLLDAYDAAVEKIDITAGQVYNIGGGPKNTISIWLEFEPILRRLLKKDIPVTWDHWRPGDQRIFIADTRKAFQELGWQPKVSVEAGIEKLVEWVTANRQLF